MAGKRGRVYVPSVDTAQVAELAGYGLTLREILARLNWEGEVPEALQRVMEQAMARGRALSAATLKEAHYQAALKGSVTAQVHMLNVLNTEEDVTDDFEEENDRTDHQVRVTRTVLDGPRKISKAQEK